MPKTHQMTCVSVPFTSCQPSLVVMGLCWHVLACIVNSEKDALSLTQEDII